ncbi:M20/M25/M40 family metallo-hydrolase [candidate division KSB1 bacterium]|nr:M20/M25/M40 family metallo-hydrolase [candidate division KSB1 bacterium]NIR70182.1 M20/M25/M40 family metallo-hydrolase [candidate division KSB1 bacterium]NIS27569.1 M20/M25/M40 family metallo-hydrolase [candidate division KSB1 bacterium]NIT74421.1 M20/M25/M40 family metallo-hydrolase [candidate division KSB1 bacterium]NIU28286.1 M20/M25/M40 family metallo-hydrolase [candidate division KSB1 bacterium]
MKSKLPKTVGFLLLGVLCVYSFTNQPSRTAIDSIRPDDVRRHIDFIASDSLKGRNTPSEGLDIAADYLAEQFEAFGLKPLKASYSQEFDLNRVRLGEQNAFKLSMPDGSEKRFRIRREFMPFEYTANKVVEAELTFVGYGISASEFRYDDYGDIDVSGKIVVILKHEPGEKDPESPFEGVKNSTYGQMNTKVELAIERGAAGMIVVNDPFNHRSLRPRGFPWPSLYRKIPNAAIPYTLSITEGEKIPVIHAGKSFIRAVFGSVDSLEAIQKRIDANLQPNSFNLENFTASIQTSTEVESEATQNVVAIWEGSDPELKKQAIVIGAHYDHVGYKKDEVKPGEDYIFNGADDNASGTVGLLEVAEAFSLAGHPKRSVIFIAFAGEEKGLFGSRYYVAKPLWPLSKTKAMVNMDMIGRNEGDRVSIIGYSHSPELNQINTEENKYVGLDLRYDGEQYFRRSDQFSFARKGIPVLFYNTGTHADYHQVSDNPDKINEGKIAMICRLVFRTAWRAANTSEELTYVEPIR